MPRRHSDGHRRRRLASTRRATRGAPLGPGTLPRHDRQSDEPRADGNCSPARVGFGRLATQIALAAGGTPTGLFHDLVSAIAARRRCRLQSTRTMWRGLFDCIGAISTPKRMSSSRQRTGTARQNPALMNSPRPRQPAALSCEQRNGSRAARSCSCRLSRRTGQRRPSARPLRSMRVVRSYRC